MCDREQHAWFVGGVCSCFCLFAYVIFSFFVVVVFLFFCLRFCIFVCLCAFLCLRFTNICVLFAFLPVFLLVFYNNYSEKHRGTNKQRNPT